jgi:arsenate reductase
MAESFLQKLDKSLDVFSAGLHPDENTDRMAVEVMKEIGIDISTKKPRSYYEFEGVEFDYLITLCDGTKDKIDTVNIQARHHIHLGFEDPKKAYCAEEQLIDIYRDIRDEIKNELDYFYRSVLNNKLKS